MRMSFLQGRVEKEIRDESTDAQMNRMKKKGKLEQACERICGFAFFFLCFISVHLCASVVQIFLRASVSSVANGVIRTNSAAGAGALGPGDIRSCRRGETHAGPLSCTRRMPWQEIVSTLPERSCPAVASAESVRIRRFSSAEFLIDAMQSTGATDRVHERCPRELFLSNLIGRHGNVVE